MPRRRPEIVAAGAAPDVELVPDDRKPHRMRAVEKLAVSDGVESDVDREVGGSAAVPADAMSRFSRLAVVVVHFVC